MSPLAIEDEGLVMKHVPDGRTDLDCLVPIILLSDDISVRLRAI